ncbi:diacylglycerol kinase family lipid kinase [Rubrobacter taiwanensis]|uniref:Diacylglycerol kinase family lipid kinase n=1 Tax=Rubrobacter taiwanensis TaxID=185139 RepID=A0A4R1BST9_9ACTN|nr:diacylglycerol kinase family protein [Rubrobacter taiwanensis]TCJ20708.1 diacylglycerol kinase family lipid kinase [Rubrobacter taiwanensis]
MEGREVHLILNPVAGKGRAAGKRGRISRFLDRFGIEHRWHVTRGPGDATGIVAGLPEGALPVAVGGDGTVHEVALACIGTRRIMGVLPAGSGNDYVKALGIGPSLERGLRALAAGCVREVDAGEVNGVRFNNGLGIGFDAEVAANVVKAPAWLGGFGRYMWAVYRLLRELECREARITLDGEVVETKTVLVAVALGTTYGARFRLAPISRLDDGLFDVIWSEEVGIGEVLRLIPSVLRGRHLDHPKVHHARAREVAVELERVSPAHVDGELLPLTGEFQARVLPRALRVVAPPGE